MPDDVARWLEELGLAKYTAVFAENAIDLDILPHLSEEDFKELGLPLGHRRKLQAAIRSLHSTNQSTAESASNDALPSSEAERRQLTVMFCDLVGSTALSERFDPEDLTRIIHSYQDCCAGIVSRYQGYIARYMGDGMLVYFGYPRTHEDEADRALHAGLDIIDAVSKLQPYRDLTLQVRIGVATGLVVVGETIGSGASQEQVALGETPNLAARLQALAQTNSIVISPSTRHLVGGAFEYADLGHHTFKGFSEPVQAWRVIGARTVESRFEALHGTQLTSLVGRDEELGLVLSRWQRARNGEGQLVLLSGEAGIGKSRIIETLLERVAAEPHTRLRYYCSPYHTESALHPVTLQLERAAGLAADDDPKTKLDKLETVLSQGSSNVADVMPLIAALLSVPFGDRYPGLNLTPPAQKAKTFDALLEQLQGLAATQPVLVVLEDAHWLDPTTSELFERIIDGLQGWPALLLISFRPEFTTPWTGYAADVTSLTLNRLGRNQGAEMVERITEGKSLPAEVVEQIVLKTDGVPLFVEELTKAILESELLRDAGDHYELNGPLPALAIPTTLHDSLMSRLDRFAGAKVVAQVGSVIGREFLFTLLAAVASVTDEELQEGLNRLVDAELAFRRGTPPDATYTFKHALVQDAAYESLLKSKRQQLHGRVAEVLEDRFPEMVEINPELIAYHFTAANLTEQAIHYWQKAGQRSSQRSATVEAITQLSEALQLLDKLPESVERDRKELDLRIDLTTPLIASKGFSAPEMGATIARSRELCEKLGETTRLFPVLYGQWVFHHISGQVEKGLEFAKEAARLAEAESSEVPKMVAFRTLGIGLIGLGQPRTARDNLSKGNELYDAERHRPLALVYGFDFKEVNLAYLALADWFDGYPERALERSRETVDFARSLSHANSLCHGLCFGAGTLHTFSRRFDAAQAVGEELLRLSAEHEMPQWSLFGRLFLSFGMVAAGREDEGMSMLRDCLARCRKVPMLANSTLAYAILCENQAKRGDYQDALLSLGEAEKVIEAGGERWAHPEILRLKGEIARAQSFDADAEMHFRNAIDVAHAQTAKPLELRAATSLARFWRDQGRSTEAYDLLAPVYDAFSEGFDTVDLREGKALLEELS